MQAFLSVIPAFLVASTALASDLPARNCQIFVKDVQSNYSSHRSASMSATVKVNWLNGETIRRVGAYQIQRGRDLGNNPGCHFEQPSEPTWKIVDASAGDRVGESKLTFKIESGSVVSQCPGFEYSTEVAFFVQTDRNTYWLNPGFDRSRGFIFDRRGFDLNVQRGGASSKMQTWREDMRYYNPGNCR